MICLKCNTVNENDSVFCKQCGNALKSGSDNIMKPVKEKVRTKKTKAPVIIATLLVITVILVIGGIVFAKPYISEFITLLNNDNTTDSGKKDKITDPVNTRGNTVGNLANTGFVAAQGDWIYYRNTTMNNKLFKIKTDDTEKAKITEDQPRYINVIGIWIYYVNESDEYKIYKVKTDGTARTKLNDDESRSITVVDDWIYYLNIKDGSKLYKMKTDGSSCTKISDDESAYPIPMDGWIYYINNTHGKEVYKIKTNGTENTALAGKDGVSCLNLSGNTLFYINDFGSLFCMGTEGVGFQTLNDGGDVYGDYYKTIHTINIEGDTIYFSNMKLLSMDLGVMKVSQQNWTKLYSQDWITNINLAGDEIYFTDIVGKLYKIQKDGESFIPVE